MNPWQFLKRQFQRGKNSDDSQETVTRLVDLSFSLLQGGNYIEARGLLLRALDYQTEIQNPLLLDWILTSLSRTWEETEEYGKWAEFLSDFIARNPNHVVAYNLRAESHWYGGNLRDAIGDYSRTLELNPNDAGAFLGRGQVFLECHDFTHALKDLDLALALMDSVPYANEAWKADFEAFARNGRAAAYAGLGDLSRAVEEFDKSIALCPENAWVYFNRAQVCQNQGDRENAVANYRLAIRKKRPKLTSAKRVNAENQLSALTG